MAGSEPTIDYEAAGYDNRSVVIGTIVPDESKPSIDRIADVSGVVDVRELITDEENVSIELVGGPGRDRTPVEELAELGIEIVRTEMVKRSIENPFDGFGKSVRDRDLV